MRAAPNLGADYQNAFDAIYPKLAAKYGVPLYPFFLDGVAGQPGLRLEDGMHPNAEGVDNDGRAHPADSRKGYCRRRGGSVVRLENVTACR